jgi:AraC-like DNA-binding protein
MMDRTPLDCPLPLHGSTFDDMVERFTKSFGPFDATPIHRTREFSWHAEIQRGGAATLVTGHYQAEWQGCSVAETPEWLSVIVPRTGGLGMKLGRQSIECGPGDMLLINSREVERFVLQGTPNLSDVLRLDWSVITQAAAAVFDMPFSGALDLSPVLDLNSQAGQMVGNLAETMITGMRNNGPLIQSPAAMAHMTQALIDVLLRSTPHRLSHLLHRKPHLIAPSHVRRAIDFMQANIDQPITMQTVAEAAGVSISALEDGFQRFKETTPAAYLRAIRLKAARTDLLDPSNQASIKDICLKWGFFHFGRFSVIYRQTFGESPSDTRKRSGL